MNNLSVPPILPMPVRGQLALLITPAQPGSMVFDLSARLALRGALCVLDAGNTFNVYEVTRVLRRSTPAWQERLKSIQLARAFTCYQVAAMLADTPASRAAAPPIPEAILVLDFLATFQDENIPLRDRWRLLRLCLKDLQRLSRAGSVAVWVRLRSAPPPEMSGFIDTLKRASDRVWQVEEPRQEQLTLTSSQPELF